MQIKSLFRSLSRRHSAFGLLILLILLTLPFAPQLAAQDADASEDVMTRVVRTRYIDTTDLDPVLALLRLRSTTRPQLGALVVQGTVSELDAFQRIVDALDVPPEPSRDLEMVVYVLAASSGSTADAGLPEKLQPVAERLAGLFGLERLSLLDTTLLRVRDGQGGSVESSFDLGETSIGYQLIFRQLTSLSSETQGLFEEPQDARESFRVDKLMLRISKPGATDGYQTWVDTDVELALGQRAVVGKAAPPGVDETLVLLVEVRPVPKTAD